MKFLLVKLLQRYLVVAVLIIHLSELKRKRNSCYYPYEAVFGTMALHKMAYFLGVDIGSVNVKLLLVDDNGDVVRLDTEKVISSPKAAVSLLIARIGEMVSLEQIVAAGVSGSGKNVIPKELN